MSDNVNHPAHYNTGKIEVIDAIEDWQLGFHAGNIIKYVARAKHKNGVEDLRKAAWYLNRLIDLEEKQHELLGKDPVGLVGPVRQAADDSRGKISPLRPRRDHDTSGPREELGQQSSHSVAEDDGEYQ